MFSKIETEKVFNDMATGVFPAKADAKTDQPSVVVTLSDGNRYFVNRKEITRIVDGVEQPTTWEWRVGDQMRAQTAPPVNEVTA